MCSYLYKTILIFGNFACMLSKLPPSKTENIVIQNLESELLIYNLETNKVFCLNETSALVYRYCDGKTEIQELKNEHNLTDEIVFLALDLLKKENLLEESFVSPLLGMKRREVIKKIGLTSMIALPIISSLMAPSSAMAAASCGGTSAPGTFLGCVPAPENCLNMFQMCTSCSTTPAFEPLCPVAAPIGCTCS